MNRSTITSVDDEAKKQKIKTLDEKSMEKFMASISSVDASFWMENWDRIIAALKKSGVNISL